MGGGRLLECENPPPVLVNAHPSLFPACQLSAPWAFAKAVTVCICIFSRGGRLSVFLSKDMGLAYTSEYGMYKDQETDNELSVYGIYVYVSDCREYDAVAEVWIIDE